MAYTTNSAAGNAANNGVNANNVTPSIQVVDASGTPNNRGSARSNPARRGSQERHPMERTPDDKTPRLMARTPENRRKGGGGLNSNTALAGGMNTSTGRLLTTEKSPGGVGSFNAKPRRSPGKTGAAPQKVRQWVFCALVEEICSDLDCFWHLLGCFGSGEGRGKE